MLSAAKIVLETWAGLAVVDIVWLAADFDRALSSNLRFVGFLLAVLRGQESFLP